MKCLRVSSPSTAKPFDGHSTPVSKRAAIHMISAFACDQQLILGQRKVDDKSNEITAIPELLALLALKGAIVTIDAMGCQRKICQQIIDQNADYVIGLKGNQGTLREDVELFFDEHLERGIGGDFIRESETVDADHGRIETRRYTICSNTDWLTERHNWPGLKAVIMSEYEREIRGKAETVRRFHIASFIDSPRENGATHPQSLAGGKQLALGARRYLPTGRLPHQKRQCRSQFRHNQHGGDKPVAPRPRQNQPATKEAFSGLG